MNDTPITPDAMIACVHREIAMRQRVYPGLVRKGTMRPDEADRELEAMKAVAAYLEGHIGAQLHLIPTEPTP